MSDDKKDISYRKTLARLMAVQGLYSLLQGGSILEEEGVMEQAKAFLKMSSHGEDDTGHMIAQAEENKVDNGYFRRIITGVPKIEEQITGKIEELLSDDWSMDRIPPLTVATLQAAAYEFYAEEKAPTKAIIAEYLKIAELFQDDNEYKFIHAMLDKLAKSIRP